MSSAKFETEYNRYVNEQKHLKENTAQEAKQITRKLSPSDVKLLKAFLGYGRCANLRS